MNERELSPVSLDDPGKNEPIMGIGLCLSGGGYRAMLFHLGVIADPSTGTKTKNIELAKQSIDIIALLGEKTKGNLTEEEDGMLKSLLYDLRMIYVKETQ